MGCLFMLPDYVIMETTMLSLYPYILYINISYYIDILLLVTLVYISIRASFRQVPL